MWSSCSSLSLEVLLLIQIIISQHKHKWRANRGIVEARIVTGGLYKPSVITDAVFTKCPSLESHTYRSSNAHEAPKVYVWLLYSIFSFLHSFILSGYVTLTCKIYICTYIADILLLWHNSWRLYLVLPSIKLSLCLPQWLIGRASTLYVGGCWLESCSGAMFSISYLNVPFQYVVSAYR